MWFRVHSVCSESPLRHELSRISGFVCETWKQIPDEAFWKHIDILDPIQSGIVSAYKMSFNAFYFSEWYYKYLAFLFAFSVK